MRSTVKDRIIPKELMLGLNEIIEWCGITNSVCWNGHVLMRGDGHGKGIGL